MSLNIQNLTKIYGQQKAVNDISFSIGKGEIVGFLGPNGAGKSTTMKVATGFVSPTSGTVTVGGFDVVEQPMQVKRIIGYLPEHNPLYLDMFVHEYLHFIGSLYTLGSFHLKTRIREIIDLCGLGQEQNKLIGSLSKGYRQRVGIAQALIHNPDVLILDEPTSGLDPNQLVEIRKLIKEISANKTVIFSTHIMQEVQALCDRVIVINQGQLVADDLLQNLVGQKTHAPVLVIEFKENVAPEDIARLAGVDKVIAERKHLRVFSRPGADVRAEIFRFASEKNISLLSLKEEENSMEEIFKSLTATHPV
ncbi:MAG TPA: gliding motility-associated ABC transporter ATP-binding subunit GldA [Cyclobacteriaceae bacterium]|nr:gliding motility-associated ABC transporter ATP-binding subunit GldA [Cyclobacteriaceae bacterium]